MKSKMSINDIFLLYSVFFIASIFNFNIVECFNPTYSITAPKIIKPRDDYNVIVSLHDVLEPTEVVCNLKKSSYKQNNDSNANLITISKKYHLNESSLLFKMKVDTDWTDGGYKLFINGTGGFTFNEVININFVDEKFNIMVQSDKIIYKPGETVLFRVLILDQNLKPVNIKHIPDMRIHITDPLDNKLRELFLNNTHVIDPSIHTSNKFDYTIGVTNDILYSLQNKAMLGKWQIQVVIGDQIQNYTFYVDNYQTQLANVIINIPAYVTYNNTILEYKVDCFYKLGKKVKGSVNVLITKSSECGKNVDESRVWSQKFLIDGQISEKIDLNKTGLLNPKCSEMRLNITAIVEDGMTEFIYINFEEFDVYQNDIRVQLLSKQKKFKPGKTIRQHFKVLSVDGDLISKDVIEQIKCEAIFKTGTIEGFNITSNDNKNIVCDFKTDINTTEIYTRIQYRGHTLWESFFESFTGCSNAFVQILLEEPLEQLMVGQKINLIISSNEPIKKLIYYIVTQGSILNSSLIVSDDVTENFKTMSILLTEEMVPEAFVTVFPVSPISGVIISDTLHLRVTSLYHPEVTFDVRTPLVDSSEEASFYIGAEEDSHIFILGEDEMSLALGQENDIIEKRVLKILRNSYRSIEFESGFFQSGMEFKSNAQPECDPKEVHNPDRDELINKKYYNKYLKKQFRETWIWDRALIHQDKNREHFDVAVLNSISSWRLTAFSVHEEKGLGLTSVTGHVKVFRPFFIELFVPFSLKREETSEIHVTVFNYMNETSDVEIKIHVSNENQKNVTLIECMDNFLMKTNDKITFICHVTAENVGIFHLLAIANATSGSQKVSDEKSRSLLVFEEGVAHQMSQSVLFDLATDKNTEIIERRRIEYPVGAIVESQKVYASVTAELITIPWNDELGVMANKRTLLGFKSTDLSYPFASCQQRTVFSFPKVYWLEFLKISNKLTKEITEFAEDIIQKTIDLLCFQNSNDGSFVTWDSKKSSVWQTAYILKLLNHAKAYVKISDEIIERAKNWLKTKQVKSGEFLEDDIEHQIISTTKFSAYLTSYVYIALKSSDIEEHNPDAVTYLAEIFDSLTHPLDIVITCYALHIANNQTCYNKMIKMSKLDSGMRYWKGSNDEPDLQITAYALMILNIRKANEIALDVFKYLISKQHPNGWFAESYVVDGNSLTTVICLEAMTQYIKLMSNYDPKNENMLINFKTGDKKQSLHIKNGKEILQSFELNADTKDIEITANGTGRSKAQIYWQFYTKESIGNSFNISARRVQKRGDGYISLDICTKCNLKNKVKNAILEIDLPSGYIYDKNEMKNISEVVDHIETTYSDTHINVYLREVTNTGICVSLSAFQSFKVRNIKPISLKVYPYYDRRYLTTRSWNILKDL